MMQDIDDNLLEMYEIRARQKGKTLEEEMRALIHSTRGLTTEEKVAVSRYLRSGLDDLGPLPTSSELRKRFG